MSLIRPPIVAGPISRNLKLDIASLIDIEGVGAATGVAPDFGVAVGRGVGVERCAAAVIATTSTKHERTRRSSAREVFIIIHRPRTEKGKPIAKEQIIVELQTI
jgi:hypothetical protein